PLYPPLKVSADALRQWQLDMAGVTELFRAHNGLSGVPEALTERHHFLGHCETDRGKAACLLALTGNHDLVAHLACLPILLPGDYQEFVVATLTSPKPTEKQRLESLRITLSPIDQKEPFRLTGLTLRGGLFFDNGL